MKVLISQLFLIVGIMSFIISHILLILFLINMYGVEVINVEYSNLYKYVHLLSKNDNVELLVLRSRLVVHARLGYTNQ